MKRKKQEILKRLIRKADLGSPAVDFTSLVMEQVQEESKNELIIDPELKLLIQQNAIIKAPSDLTYSVMTQVKTLSICKSYEQVIIGKKAWLIIGAAFIMFITYVLLSDQYLTTSQTLTTDHINIGNELNAILNLIYSIPMIYIVVVVSFSVLLIFDYLLKAYFHQKAY